MHEKTKNRIVVVAHAANVTDKITTLIGVFMFGVSWEGNPLLRSGLEFYGVIFGVILFTVLGHLYIEFFRRKNNLGGDIVIVFCAVMLIAVTILNTVVILSGA